MGHQASLLERFSAAHDAFAALLHERSAQSPAQQLLFLREYVKEAGRCPDATAGPLVLPVLRPEKTLVLAGGSEGDWAQLRRPAQEPVAERWHRLESAALVALGRPAEAAHLARPALARLDAHNHISPLIPVPTFRLIPSTD